MKIVIDREIYDRTLHSYLHKLIEEELTPQQKRTVQSIKNCCKRIIKPNYGESGVYLLAKKNKARFFGTAFCKNAWACPVCTPKVMFKHSRTIGLMIDEMKKRGYFGIMITFTIPHLRWFGCRETTDILYNTLRRMHIAARGHEAKKRNCKRNVFCNFFDELEINNRVVVCEYTWGKNGWHPHFHAIYWCKRGKEQKALEYEKALNEQWLAWAKFYTKKYWEENQLHRNLANVGKLDEALDKLYETCEKDAGILIGKKGNLINEAKSSDYIAGWGSENELTNLRLKEATTGHYTPHQILEKAYLGDEKFKKVYIEFLLAIKQHPIHLRVCWSCRTEITQLRKLVEQQQKCYDLVKKNTQSDKKEDRWKVLCWFTKEQWYCLREMDIDNNVTSNILWLAAYRPDLLFEFLESMNIGISAPKNMLCEQVEEIFNKEAA